MPKIAFQDFRFQTKTLDKIALAEQIIQVYERQGYKLTLRQLYYQMVARDLIPNNQRSYKNLGAIIGNARLAGLIDWNSIEDRLRKLVKNPHWTSPASIIRSAAEGYRNDLWRNQPCRIEIWVEKDALSGVLTPIAEKHDVGFFAARGYPSLSEMYSAGKRFARYAAAGQEVHVLHLGDHDPSGMDMTRDIEDRVSMFAQKFLKVNRLALNWDQIELYNPPPNPAKQTDSRFERYVEQYGDESWELDALDPATLASIVEPVILEHRDDTQWEIDLEKQMDDRDDLETAADHWHDVADFLEDYR
ncbi:hypothetical protein KAR91_77660 [Candidatus Pacearchaeota archaeon]|nr:hypothetical protein [Candidatus Pacearchaeota archaeon]